MKLLIDLLERKNLCFKSFHGLCSEFLDEISAGKIDNLEKFQSRRQALLHVVENVENEINAYLAEYETSKGRFDAMMTSEARTKINFLIRDKESMVRAIIDLDEQILKHIDLLKEDTVQKLQSIQTGRKTLGAYRSPMDQVENAENKLKTIDQEV